MVRSIYKPENAQQIIALGQHSEDERSQHALNYIERYGLPTKRLERWKYSDLQAAIKGLNINSVSATSYETTLELNQNTEATHKTHGYERQSDDTLRLISELYANNGHEIVIGKEASSSKDTPLRLSQLLDGQGTLLASNLVVRIEKGVECYIQQDINIKDALWYCEQVTYILEQGANLVLARHPDFHAGAVYTCVTKVIQKRDSNFNAYIYYDTGTFVRDEYEVDLIEQNANCEIHSALNLNGTQHIDNTILINHIAPHCTSRQFVRNVLNGKSRGVFQGKTHVFRDAQKTDGYQMCNALLLTKTAEMNAKPELEIYADDVQCSHGSTMGQMDEDALFYMKARGIDEDEAKGLLIHAFLSEVFESCPEAMRPYKVEM